jgi:hypothetical protein
MNRICLSIGVLALAAAMFACAPANSQQNMRPPLHGGPMMARSGASWRGSVDDTVNISFRGMQTWETVVSGKGANDVHSHVFSALPAQTVNVMLSNIIGRGQVVLLQQPHRRNNYTAVVRIIDPQPGRSEYHFRLTW